MVATESAALHLDPDDLMHHRILCGLRLPHFANLSRRKITDRG